LSTRAAVLAARVIAELAEELPTSLAFKPIEVDDLIAKWLEHHETIRRSSLATVRRYRTAVQHLTYFMRTAARSCKPIGPASE
jgi:hypothetical protein